VDTYGKWLPKGNPGIADLLDDRSEPLANLVVAASFPTARPPLWNCFLLSSLGLVDRMGIEPTTS